MKKFESQIGLKAPAKNCKILQLQCIILTIIFASVLSPFFAWGQNAQEADPLNPSSQLPTSPEAEQKPSPQPKTPDANASGESAKEPAPAPAPPTETKSANDTIKAPTDSLERKLIRTNIAVSEWFDGMAEGLDLFLVGKKVTKKPNETSIRIENLFLILNHEGTSNSTAFNFNLRLPNVEEYWQLKFSNYDETTERGVERNYIRRTPRSENYGATVGFFRKLGKVRVSFKPRIQLKEPLYVSHTLALESVAEYTKFSFNPRLELFANPNDGTGFFQALNFNFELSDIYSLTLINEAQYNGATRLFTVNQGFSVGQLISSRSSLSYNAFVSSSNLGQYHLDAYFLSVGWNHALYRRIFDYSIAPRLDFPKFRDFKPSPGIALNVGLNF